MKILIALIGLVCMAYFEGKAQNTFVTGHQKVQQTIVDLFEGFSAFDVNHIASLCTEDVKILEDGVVWNIDSLRVKINPEKAKTVKRVNRLDFIQTELQGNMAWTAYHNRAEITMNGKTRTIQWLESAVLVQEGKKWKVKLLHSTVIEPAEK